MLNSAFVIIIAAVSSGSKPAILTSEEQQILCILHYFIANTNFSFADYIPGQFAAFNTTFGINTLSDIKTVNTKIQLKMVEAVTAKKDTAENVEILNDAMKNIKIEQDAEKSTDENAATAVGKGMKNNPNVYIPNQFQVLTF